MGKYFADKLKLRRMDIPGESPVWAIDALADGTWEPVCYRDSHSEAIEEMDFLRNHGIMQRMPL